MFWRWLAVGLLIVAALFFLNLAGGMLFAADVPAGYYKDPNLKGQFVFWANVYGALTVASFGSAVAITIFNIRRIRKKTRDASAS